MLSNVIIYSRLARIAGWNPYSRHALQHAFPGLDLYYYADPAQPLTPAGRDVNDLYVDDLSVDDMSVRGATYCTHREASLLRRLGISMI